MKKKQTVKDFLSAHPSACDKARAWLLSLGPDATMAQAWAACVRSDWMLWALHETRHRSYPGPRHFALDCAERALQSERAAGREPDPRSWEAIRVTRAWLACEVDDAALAAARTAAWAAARTAAWAAARAAARAVSWAAAEAAARTAAMADARAAAEDAAEAAARAASWDAARAWQADRLRYYVPEWPEVQE